MKVNREKERKKKKESRREMKKAKFYILIKRVNAEMEKEMVWKWIKFNLEGSASP